MGNVTTYSGLTTKIRAMQAKLLKDKDFEEIINLKSVPDLVEYLKENTSYGPYMELLDMEHYHRGDVEKVLTQSFFDDYTRIFRFAGMEQKKFLKSYWKRYEVNLINYCCRIVFNHYDVPFDIDYKKEVFDRYSQLSVDKLVTSKSISELVENLKGTEYYDSLNKVRESGAEVLYDYELALELYYFSTFWTKEKRLLKGSERELFIKDYGTKIDLLNLQWIYRAKKYYHMLPPDIYAMTIPIHYRIRMDEFKTLVETPSVEEFVNRAKETKYGGKIDMEASTTPEKQGKAILRGLYLSQFRRDPYSIASINTYLYLKEEEIDKLTTALECIRYGLSSRETSGYLGGVNS